jgi:putative spermidine/putrescine transport system substrate-binding protein
MPNFPIRKKYWTFEIRSPIIGPSAATVAAIVGAICRRAGPIPAPNRQERHAMFALGRNAGARMRALAKRFDVTKGRFDMLNWTRRRFVSAAAAVAATASATAMRKAAAADSQELRLLVWEGYADDDWVKEFEDQTKAKVSVVYLTSDDEMWTKLKGSNGQDYDVFSVNTGDLKKFIDAGLTTPFDLDKLPNRNAQLDSFKDLDSVPTVKRDGKVYGIPLAWGSIGLIYDTEKVNPAPTSWNVLWDPQYKGRVLIFDSSGQDISLGALALGFKDPFHLTKDQMAQVKQKMIALKPQLKTYYQSFDEGTQLWENGDPVLMYSMGELQQSKLKDDKFKTAYIIPNEGALGWIDTWAMTSGVRNKDLAEAWVNFFLSKKISEAMTTKHGYGNTVSNSAGLDYSDKLKWIVPYEDFAWRTDVWNEIKAAQ